MCWSVLGLLPLHLDISWGMDALILIMQKIIETKGLYKSILLYVLCWDKNSYTKFLLKSILTSFIYVTMIKQQCICTNNQGDNGKEVFHKINENLSYIYHYFMQDITCAGSAPGIIKSPATRYFKMLGLVSPFFISECENPAKTLPNLSLKCFSSISAMTSHNHIRSFPFISRS